MGDIIQLLPDSVANQIAAGEVVQRPASVVKELVENSIDAAAKQIDLVVKDGGRTLIQVIDNGNGMSDTDARLSLERHATSKIRKSEDLFHISTMGFRGEAIASIVAIAQCEIKTKLEDDELGTRLVVEGSTVKKQEPCACPKGTTTTVKNLFYNVPARRKFLKSNAVENRHIIDQFERVALINPHVGFSLVIDDTSIFHLEPGSLRQRIVSVFGKKINDKLVPVFEESNIVNLGGFVGKPESAKKTRGEQYLFVNGRFVKSNYLHHAVLSAFDGLISHGNHPSYFLTVDCDPTFIDINIHPTKTEIKFEDERSVYAILFSTIKKALGEHNIVPTLDFERETIFDSIDLKQSPKAPNISVNQNFNPFSTSGKLGKSNPKPSSEFISGYSKFFDQQSAKEQATTLGGESDRNTSIAQIDTDETQMEIEAPSAQKYLQILNRYIITAIKSGMIMIDQHRAHQRILFEDYMATFENQKPISQQSLFPCNLEFSSQDAALIRELLPQFNSLGFDLEDFGKNSFILRGVPMGNENANGQEIFEGLLDRYKENLQDLNGNIQASIALTLAQKNSIKSGRKLMQAEIADIVDRLFACGSPYYTPTGRPIIITYNHEDLNKQFK